MTAKTKIWGAVGLTAAYCFTLSACDAQLSGEDSDLDSPPGQEETPLLPGGLRLEGKPQYFRVVRLTHAQWENSVRDVLRLPELPGVSTTFIPDPPDGTFSNNERALYVTDTLNQDYQRGAESVAKWVAENAALLDQLSATRSSSELIASVGRRAFRRALTPDEQSTYERIWGEGSSFYESGDAFADGARVFIESLLQSPYFVYRVETSPAGGRLSGYELATKLSYLLRNTTPSEALLGAAERGELDTEQGVRELVSALLNEDEVRDSFENFHRELFGLDRYRSIVKSETAFPMFSESLNPVLLEADLLFFSHVYTEGLGFREILTSNVAFVNDLTAAFYGVTARGSALQKMTLDESRPGFLTRLGFLAYNANLIDPDPIHRGIDINSRLLCLHISPPAGEIPPLPTPVPGQTNRERVVAHTSEGFCGSCHNDIINPPGFALESFDAVGRLRTTDNGKPIDTTGRFRVGEEMVEFSNIAELTHQLASSALTHSCYSMRLAEFAFGRDLGPGEVALVSSTQTSSLESNASVKSMLLSLLSSPEFSRPSTEAL